MIQLPSPSVKIQIMGGKVCLIYKGKTLLDIVNKLFIFKSFLTNVLSLQLEQTNMNTISNEGEGVRIKYRIPIKINSTLP